MLDCTHLIANSNSYLVQDQLVVDVYVVDSPSVSNVLQKERNHVGKSRGD